MPTGLNPPNSEVPLERTKQSTAEPAVLGEDGVRGFPARESPSQQRHPDGVGEKGGGSCRGAQRVATPGCEGASLCGMAWGVVGLLIGGGVRAVEVRSGAPRYLMRKIPSSLQYYLFGFGPSLAVGSTRAGQGEMSKG